MMPHALQIEELTIADFTVAGRQMFVAISAPHRFALRYPPTLIGMGPRTFRAVLSINGVSQPRLWYREPPYCSGSIFVQAASTPEMRGFWCQTCGSITDILCALDPGSEACEYCARFSSPSHTFLVEYRDQLFELDPRPTISRPSRVPLHLLRSWRAPWEQASVEYGGWGE